MRAERRLARLEGELPPAAAVRHWLGEVHDHGSLQAYLEERLEAPGVVPPLVTLTELAQAAARRAYAGEPLPVRREAERRATADTLFLVLLVVEAEHETVGLIRRGTLCLEALRWELRARRAEGTRDPRGWAAWRSAVLELATELARSDAARRLVAARYLDGVELMSPVVLGSWAELQDGVRALVEALPIVPGGRRRARRDAAAMPTTAEGTAPEEASRIVMRVRARTFELLGEPDRALRIVLRAIDDARTGTAP